MQLRIGIDLGGTKTELIALDGSGAERFRKRVPTPAHDYAAILACVAGLVNEAELRLGARGTVGVGTPGAPSPETGLLRNSNTACLNGRPVREDLIRALGREVRIANDANCFALSEAVDGAGRSAGVVFGAILGTGVGGGIVVDGRLLHGRNAIGGEWGHNPLPWPRPDELPGPACYCGKHGCIETFVSGTGLTRDYALHGGSALGGAEIAARAERGDAAANAALERYEGRLARALAAVINLLDPDVIVLGGGVSRVLRLYNALPAQLPAHVFSDKVATRIAAAAHGDASGVRGAAWLWPIER
jgi:fructokinase